MKTFTLNLKEVHFGDSLTVGLKNAYLGELSDFDQNPLLMPTGFAITTEAFKQFICYNDLENALVIQLHDLQGADHAAITEISSKARQMIMQAKMPGDVSMAIIDAYDYMFDMTEQAVAVSSSFVFEMPFENDDQTIRTGLNVQGHSALLYAVKECFSNLFSISSLLKIAEENITIPDLGIAVCVQQLVDADKASSGTCNTTDPKFKSEDVLHISAVRGLKMNNCCNPDGRDDYWIYKPSLFSASALVETKPGNQQRMLVAADEDDYCNQTQTILVSDVQPSVILNHTEVLQLAKYGIRIENKFNAPVMLSWVKDGINHQLYIVTVYPYPADAGKNKEGLSEPQKAFWLSDRSQYKSFPVVDHCRSSKADRLNN